MGGQNQKVETCTYKPEWQSMKIDSSNFKEQGTARNGCPGYTGSNTNFPSNVDPGTSTDYAPPPLLVGDISAPYSLNENLIDQLSPDTLLPLAGLPGISSLLGSATVATQQPPPTIETSN